MKKKFISGVVIAWIVLNMFTVTFAVSGTGTESNPFRITNEEELLLLLDFPNCYFELENDIEIVDVWVPVEDFSGNLDGKGNTITISSCKETDNVGLFGILSGTVKNLTVNTNDVTFTSSSASNHMGVIAGFCSGSIEKCAVIGDFTVKAKADSEPFFGGICGELTGTISQCVNESSVTLWPYNYEADYSSFTKRSHIYYGGISYLNNGKIIDCFNLEKEITFNGYGVYYAGISYGNGGTISNCYSVGGNGNSSNDLCNYGVAYGGTIVNCYYNKSVSGYTGTETTYGIPKSTLAMKMKATYTDWDFDNIWKIDESEENPINDGYPYLKAFYPDFNAPITVSNISVAENNIIFDIKITDIAETHVLHIALFDTDKKLCNYVIIPNNRQLKDVFAVFADDGKSTYAKIFTWSSLNVVEPIATSEIIQIAR